MAGTYDLTKSPSHLLHRAGQVAGMQAAAALKAAGLTQRQFALLAALNEVDGVSQSDLVNVTGIDRSTLADMALRMEKSGFIKRKPSKMDARAKVVTIMAKGRRALDKAMPGVQAADAALLDLLPVSRQNGLVSSLVRLAAADGEVLVKPPAPKPRKPSKPRTIKTAAKKPAAKTAKKKATKKKKKK